MLRIALLVLVSLGSVANATEPANVVELTPQAAMGLGFIVRVESDSAILTIELTGPAELNSCPAMANGTSVLDANGNVTTGGRTIHEAGVERPTVLGVFVSGEPGLVFIDYVCDGPFTGNNRRYQVSTASEFLENWRD